jgi:predicted AAA+ superfamily ATPase
MKFQESEILEFKKSTSELKEGLISISAILNKYILLKNDAGQLFENFCILERMKYREYNKVYANQYFWRTYDGAEVDLVEERSGKLFAFEFKFRKSSVRKPAGWDNYKLINKNNILDILK